MRSAMLSRPASAQSTGSGAAVATNTNNWYLMPIGGIISSSSFGTPDFVRAADGSIILKTAGYYVIRGLVSCVNALPSAAQFEARLTYRNDGVLPDSNNYLSIANQFLGNSGWASVMPQFGGWLAAAGRVALFGYQASGQNGIQINCIHFSAERLIPIRSD